MINGLTLILLNFAYFSCNFYPKHLLEFNNSLSILAILLNVIFYLIFAFFLILVFNKNKNPFSDNIFTPIQTIWQNIQIKKIVLIFVSKIFFDLLKYLASGVLDKNILYFIDFSTIALWIIFYNVCVTKNCNIFLKKPLVTLIVILLTFSITMFCNSTIIREYNFLSEKYSALSEYLVINTKNLDFIFQLKNFALDTLLGLILITIHSLLNKTIIVKDRLSSVKQIIRIFILIACFCVMVSIKTLIFPYACIYGFRTLTTENSPKVETNSFYVDTKIRLISRIGTSRSEEIVFSKTQDEIFYNGNLILTYTSNDNKKSDSYIINGNQMTIEDQFEKINYSNIAFYVYKNQVICFLDDNKPTAIPFNYTEKFSYNENLLLIYKALFENCNWNFFEQGTEYLLKYDKAFIAPYLERFSLGEFSERELEMLNKLFVNKYYIQRVSKDLIGK